MKHAIYLITLLFLGACNREEALAKESVIQPAHREFTQLDLWIDEHFVQPYNIQVRYRWAGNVTGINANMRPVNEEKVYDFLQFLEEFLLQFFSSERIGGVDFMKRYAPVEIVLYGSDHPQAWDDITQFTTHSVPTQMVLYNVNGFGVGNKNAQQKYIRALLVQILRQYVKVLLQKQSYDRQGFKELNIGNYSYAFGRGKISPHRYHPDKDIAEIFSEMMTTPKARLQEIITNLSQPVDKNYPPDVRHAYNLEQTIGAKMAFIEAYFKHHFGINLSSMQVNSVIKLEQYLQNLK